MTANLLFSQTITQTHSSGIERGKMSVAMRDRAAVSNTIEKSFGNNGESFLNTLKQKAKDLNSTQQSREAGELEPSETHTYNSADNSAATTHPADTLETRVSETKIHAVKDLDSAEVQKPDALNFVEIINIFENRQSLKQFEEAPI